ncbi:MAG: hypothetical protein OYM47_00090 [Gemmatimonadota bacterium]|nr:hypothetical protein [Gemmatimonadota bacterium]
MNESRGGSRKAQNSPENAGQHEPVEQEILIRDVVREFLDTLQPVEKIESLKDPLNRRGSKKIKGRPANDPMFRIEKRPYRIFYKRYSGQIYVVDMVHRQGAYDRE